MQKFIVNIGTFLLSLLFLFFLNELFFRYAEIETLSEFEVNEKIGQKLRPNLPLLWLNEGYYLGSTNELGYLGPAYPPKKEGATFRIGLLGDSFIAGFQLAEKHHFRNRLENKFNKADQRRTQVLNFGMIDFNLSDAYCYYHNFTKQFNNDLTLIFIETSDLYELRNPLRPSCVLENGNLKIDRSFVKGEVYQNYLKTEFFRKNSAFLKTAKQGLRIFKNDQWKNKIFDKFYPGKDNKKDTLDFHFGDITKAILQELGQIGNVVIIYKKPIPNEVVKYIENLDLKTIDLTIPLKGLEKSGIDPYYWKATNTRGHWNHEAHRVISDYLFEQLNHMVP